MTATDTGLDVEAEVKKYQGLVFHIARKLTARDRHQFDDAVGDGYVGLMRSIERFDPTAGASLMTFAYRGVTMAILNGLRDRRGANRRRAQIHGDVAYSEIPLEYGADGELRHDVDFDADPAMRIERIDERSALVRRACEFLTEEQRQALATLSSDESVAPLAEALGVSMQTIYNRRNTALKRVRRHLRSAGIDA